MNTKANTAPPRILLVGLPYGLPDTDHDEFYTDKHFLDYDIVIMDPQGAFKGQGYDYTAEIHEGVLSLTPSNGVAFYTRYLQYTQKLVGFANKGGVAIVFLRPMPFLKYQIPDRYRESVTVSLDDPLPWGKNTIHRAHGSNIEFTTQGAIGRFWKTTKGLWSYEAVYSDPPKGPVLAHVKGYPDEVVADFMVTQERGFVIMTPVPSFEKTGVDPKVVKEGMERFIGAVRSLHEAFRTERPAPQLPDWASDYSLPGEIELKAEISAANGRIEALQKKVRERTKDLDELCLHKLLVTSHDSALERAVDRVLTELRFKVEPGPKGRVDRTATYGDRKFAVEVQGVKKGAKEDHARSLMIWVQEVALEDGKEPKGLLVVNPYRDTPLAERGKNNLWPVKMIELCERQGHCAMTGLQLLGLYLDARDDDTKRDQLIDRMFNTQGVFQGYDDWSQFLTPVESKANKKS